jgi:hypothetical protein
MDKLIELTPWPDEVAGLSDFGWFPREIAHTAVLGAVNAAANLLYDVATPQGRSTHIGLYLYCTSPAATGKSTIHQAVWEPHNVADDKLFQRWAVHKSRRGYRSLYTPRRPMRGFQNTDGGSILQSIAYGRGAVLTDHGGDPSHYGLTKRQVQGLNNALASCYDGDTIDSTYRNHHYYREMPRLSACLLTYNTDWLTADSGMFRRFLYCQGGYRGDRSECYPLPDLTTLHDTIATVREYADRDAELVATPHAYGLITPSEPAYELLAQYHQKLRFSPPDANQLINDWRTLAPTHALRLAATLTAWRHLASEPPELIQPLSLDVADMSQAIELIQWYGRRAPWSPRGRLGAN